MKLEKLRKIRWQIIKLKRVFSIYIAGDPKGVNFRQHLTLKQKLFCLKSGFFVEKYNLYNLKENDWRLYVSDIYNTMTIPKNGFYQQLIDNKAFLTIILKEFNKYLPAYYFTIFKPKILDHFSNKYISNDEFIYEIHALLERKGKIILKPLSMSGGSGFILLSRIENKFTINNVDISENDLNKRLSGLDKYICTEHIVNADYIKKIYPYSCNTIRILTIWDFEENKPYIARAIHRFGNNPQKTVDNVFSGGIASEIDIKTGILSKAYLWSSVNINETSDIHPVTKKMIAGVKLKNWEGILIQLNEIAFTMPFVPYMGWDIAITDESFKIIEINSNPDVEMLQVFQPLLNDIKIKKFFDQLTDEKPEKYFHRR